MRKSILLAGSALAVAGLTTAGAQKAEAAEISLGMYMPFVIGVADSDNEAENQFGFGDTDTEFYVTGKETLENGITVAVKFQFNADQNGSTSSNTDEIEIEISGSFGLISLGHEDGPEDLMNRGPQNIKSWAFGSLGDNGTGSPVALLGSVTNNEANIDSSDNIKFAYYTPRFSGFQVGLAYSKDTEIGYTGTGQTPANNASGYALGANYVNSFGEVDLAVSGTYYIEDQEDGTPATDSADRFTVGAEVGFSGFTVAADYADGTSGNGSDNTWWSVGGAYGMGPWSAHLTYESGEQDVNNGVAAGTSNENTLIHTGVAYALGPGISVGASIGFGNTEDTDTGEDKDYTVFTTGITVSF